MSGHGIILLVATLFLLFVKQDSIPTSERWRWTFYENALTSWNDAHSYCFSQNARILKIDEQLRHDVLDHFKRNEWSSVWGKEFWIGVYFDGNNINWEGFCGDTLSSSGFSNWDGDEVVSGESPCTMIDPEDELIWKAEDCKQPYRVICEEHLGPCLFEDVVAPSCLASKTPAFVTKDTFTECKDYCRTWVEDGEECWAVSYSARTKACYGGFASSPYQSQVTEVDTSCAESDEQVSFKICFTASNDPSSIDYTYTDELAVVQITDCLTTTVSPTTTTTTTIKATVTAATTANSVQTTTNEPTTSIQSTTSISTTKTTIISPTTLTTVPDLSTTSETLSSSTTVYSESTVPTTIASPTNEDASTESSTNVRTTESSTNVRTTESSTNVHTTTEFASTVKQSTEEKSITDTSTSVHTTEISSTNSPINEPLTSVTNSTCKCSCQEDSRTVEEKIEQRKKELSIDPKSTSKSKNKLISVHDHRESAHNVGWIGLSIILIIFSLIILSDCVQCCKSLSSKLGFLRNS